MLAAEAASQLVNSPIELLEDQINVSTRDANIDVSHDPNRHFFEPGPHYVAGLEVTYHLPFRGNPDLLRCRPNTFTLNPPRGVIEGQELTFPYDQANRDVLATKKEFASDLAAIKKHLGWVNAELEQHNAQLEADVRLAVIARRAELAKTSEDVAALGYPLRDSVSEHHVGSALGQEPVEARKKRRDDAGRKYDVALSFAGEDREYVEAVAARLVEEGISVFYDKYETVELWGKDLADHLTTVYSRDSHFVVLFVSRNYADKAWPNHERRSALSRSFRGEEGRVLPVRFDDTEVPGLVSTIAYLDARVLTPDKLAALIRQKVDRA